MRAIAGVIALTILIDVAGFAANAEQLKVLMQNSKGQTVTDDRFTFDTETGEYRLLGGTIHLGQDENPATPDFEWRQDQNPKIWAKSMMLYNPNDSIDLRLGRAGNEIYAPGNPLLTTLPQQRVGWLFFDSYVAECAEQNPANGWYGGPKCIDNAFIGAIDGQTDGTQTATSRPGLMNFGVTQPGERYALPKFQLKNATEPGETFLRLVYLDANGNPTDMQRVYVDKEGYLRVGTPTQPANR